MSDGFQTFVSRMPSPGIPGDFAGANIRSNVIGGPGAFQATPAGVLIGAMAYADPATQEASNYYRPNSFLGFIHREGQSIITAFLGIASQTIVQGDMVTVMNQGEFWGLFAAGATTGQKVYANPTTGALSGDATGNSVTAAASTGASITTNVLTTTDADVTGTIAVGQIVTGAGVPNGTYIASAAGTGSGTHLWNLANLDGTTIANVASEAMNFYGVQETGFTVLQTVSAPASFTASLAVPAAGTAFGVLTISAIASGVPTAGQFLAATGLPASANVQILEQLTGTAGSTGTYLTTNTYYTIASTNTFTGTVGQVGKISSWV